MHYKGFGFPQDYAKAIQQFELAAEKQNAAAMYMLGICYRNGYGVAIDTEKAKYWLNKPQLLEVFFKSERTFEVGCAVRMSPDFVPTNTSRQNKSEATPIQKV